MHSLEKRIKNLRNSFDDYQKDAEQILVKIIAVSELEISNDDKVSVINVIATDCRKMLERI